MYYDNDTFIYLNGKFTKASEAKMDLYSQTLHYGYGVFEGIRSYRNDEGKAQIFEAEAHFKRLKRSAQLLNMPYKWDLEQLIAATYELLRFNGQQNAYIRPLVYAPANMSFVPNETSYLVIEAWEMKPFLGEQLLRVMTSGFERPNPKGFKIEAKATGHYVNSILASQEAKSLGFDEALLKDGKGFVAEAPGANFFMEKNGKLYTPQTGNILPGITRRVVMEIASKMGIEVVEKQMFPEAVYDADSAFFCGTAAEVVGIESLDNIELRKPWESSIGKEIKTAYKKLVTQPIFHNELQEA